MRQSLCQWLLFGALGCALTVGCNQGQRRQEYAAARPAYTMTVVPVYPEKPAAPAPAPVAVAPAPAPKPELETLPPPPKEIQPATFKDNEPVKRRSFADITAKPGMAHAADYSWLVGELQFVHVRKAWRLRYASVDEEDRYGGSVTLTEMGTMDNFTSGQMIRVEGQLMDPESREPSPAYRVRTIQSVANP